MRPTDGEPVATSAASGHQDDDRFEDEDERYEHDSGERYDYEVSGKADPLGEIEDLWLEYGDPGLSGLGLQLTGAWRGGALHLTTTKDPFLDGRLLAAGTSSRDDPVDPDDYFAPATLTERDRAAFEATCQRIRA